MNSNVHIICHPLIKTFPTPFTLVFLFISMNLEMTTEVAFIIKRFPTHGTSASKLLSTLMSRTVILVISELTETKESF